MTNKLTGQLEAIEIGDTISLPYTERRLLIRLWRWLTFQPLQYDKQYVVTGKASANEVMLND